VALNEHLSYSSHKPINAVTTFKTGWYLLYTMPRQEKKVHSRLAELHLDSFLPTKRTQRTLCDRKKIIDEPLFPSYVFVHLKDQRNYFDGMGVKGSLNYVRFGKDLARVSDSVVDNIKLLSRQYLEMEVSDIPYAPGQRLFIKDGALTGLSCELIEVDNRRKILVRVDLLQRGILLRLPEEYLEAI
jgi:transcriptional antiterminator RfaH